MELIEVVLPAFPDAPLRAALGTDTGLRREHNEDAVGAYHPTQGSNADAPVDAAVIVADGVGGHEGGAWASAFVVDATRDTLAAQMSQISGIGRWLDRLLHSIHEELLEEARKRGTPASMGSTATLAALQGRALTLAHVGDSRAYRLRNGRIEQLTQDDSWVAEQVRAGVLASDAPEAESRKNVLTQCLGIGVSLKVQIVEDHASDGDRYLLCSDGLHGVVSDDELRRMLETGGPPEATSRTLIDLANERGGPDNISAVVFDIGDPPGLRAVVAPAADSTASGPDRHATREISAAAVRAAAGVDEAEGPSGPSYSKADPPAHRRASNWITGAGALLLIVAAGSWMTGAGRAAISGDLAVPVPLESSGAAAAAPASGPLADGPSVPQAATPSTEPDPVTAAAIPDTQPVSSTPDTLVRDTTAAPGDTTMIPDTTGIPRDSMTAPDTTAQPDTTATRPASLIRFSTPQERPHV